MDDTATTTSTTEPVVSDENTTALDKPQGVAAFEAEHGPVSTIVILALEALWHYLPVPQHEKADIGSKLTALATALRNELAD